MPPRKKSKKKIVEKNIKRKDPSLPPEVKKSFYQKFKEGAYKNRKNIEGVLSLAGLAAAAGLTAKHQMKKKNTQQGTQVPKGPQPPPPPPPPQPKGPQPPRPKGPQSRSPQGPQPKGQQSTDALINELKRFELKNLKPVAQQLKLPDKVPKSNQADSSSPEFKSFIEAGNFNLKHVPKLNNFGSLFDFGKKKVNRITLKQLKNDLKKLKKLK